MHEAFSRISLFFILRSRQLRNSVICHTDAGTLLWQPAVSPFDPRYVPATERPIALPPQPKGCADG